MKWSVELTAKVTLKAGEKKKEKKMQRFLDVHKLAHPISAITALKTLKKL